MRIVVTMILVGFAVVLLYPAAMKAGKYLVREFRKYWQ